MENADSSELSSFSDLSSITGDTIFVVLCLLSRELDPGSLEPLSARVMVIFPSVPKSVLEAKADF